MATKTKVTTENSTPWGSYDKNVYYYPENCGLKLMAYIDLLGEAYEFYDLIVLRDIATKKLYYVTDQGCSCPTPFEDVRGLSDLYEWDYNEVKEIVNAARNGYGSAPSAEDARSFLNKVRRYK